MGFTAVEKIWFNGQLVPWGEAKVHVLAHGLHYGTGVFEGIRSYAADGGTAVFRLAEHTDRFYQSAAMYDLDIPYTHEQLCDATREVVRVNTLGFGYIRPIAFFDAATLAVWTKECPVSVAIAAFPTGAYLADAEKGVRITISPIRRFDSAAIPTTGKACGQYVNSARAVGEAQKRGFDEAILLNSRGEVSEGSGENLFVVKDGVIHTNDADAGILMGITRDAVLQIAAHLGIPTRIAPIAVADLTAADEMFFSGTAVEITPIRELDGHIYGDGTPGAITRRIRDEFHAITHGRVPAFKHWLSYV